MTDEQRKPLEEIVRTISGHLEIGEPEPRPPEMVTMLPRIRTFRQFDSRNPPADPPAYTGPKNGDVPRAGELTSQVFNDLTTRIIGELKELIESQITDAVNRRAHVGAQMEAYKAEVDKIFAEFEAAAKKLQEKVDTLSEAVRKKVEAETKGMIALSNRLRDFADSVNTAHERFFKD